MTHFDLDSSFCCEKLQELHHKKEQRNGDFQMTLETLGRTGASSSLISIQVSSSRKLFSIKQSNQWSSTVLYCTVLCCNYFTVRTLLYCTVMYCTVLIVLYCAVLYFALLLVLYCIVIIIIIIINCTVVHFTVVYCTYFTVLHCTVLHYCTLPFRR